MKPRTLSILAVIAAILLVLGLATYGRRTTEFAASAPDVLYPGLIDNLDQITRIELIGPDGELTFSRSDQQWTLDQKGGYPIRVERMRTAVLALSDLSVAEPKTSKPENYPSLGVQDPGPGSESTLVRMIDRDDRPVVSVVLGKMERVVSSGAVRRYVRLTDDPRVYYVHGAANISTAWNTWVDKQIIRFTRALIHDVSIVHPDGEIVRVYRPDTETQDFIPDLPPLSPTADPLAVNLIGNMFIYVGHDDVDRFNESMALTAPGPVATVRTFDGFAFTARLFDHEDATWVVFEAEHIDPITPEYDSPAETPPDPTLDPEQNLFRDRDTIAQLVRQTNERLGGFRFRLPSETISHLSRRTSDFFPSQ